MTMPYLPPELLAALSGVQGFGAAPANLPAHLSDPMATRGVAPAPSLFSSPDPTTGLMGVVPDASGMPAAPPALPMPKKQSILDRVSMNIRKMIQGDAPAGYSQVLTPEQIDAARPTFFQTMFGHGANPDEFQKNLAGAVQAMQMPAQLQTLQHQRQVMQDIATKFAPDPNASAQQNRDRLLQMYTYGEANGADPAWLKELGDVVGKTGTYTEPVKPSSLVPVSDQSQHWTFNKDTGAWTPGPSVQMNPDQLRLKSLALAEAQARARAAESEADQRKMQGYSVAFNNQNRDISQSARAIELARTAFDELAAGNPVAYKSAIVSFAGVADPKAQLRQGIIEMIAKLDPSVHGSLALAAARLESGSLPPYILEGLRQHVEQTRQSMMKLYQQRLADYAKARPGVENWISPADIIFGPSVAAAAQPNASQGKVQQYLQP